VVLEAGTRLGAQATAQNAAILRTPMPDPVLEELAREGAEFLRAPPPGFAREPLLDACGLVLLCAPDTDGERAWRERLARRGGVLELRPRELGPRELGARELSAPELRARAPHVRAAGDCAFLIPDEGRVDVPALAAAFERGARALGVRFELGARVRALAAGGHGVELDDGRALAARRVVLAAGAWAGPLARAAGSRIELVPARRHLLVTRASAAVDPRWPVVWRDDVPFYARPERGGLLFSACDEEPCAPADLCAEPCEAQRARERARRFLDVEDPFAAQSFWAGLRTHAADERFVLGPDPDVEGLVWAGALGGHGITCAAPAGAIAAEWVLAGRSTHRLAPHFEARRFARPAARAERADARA
jgi:D-arginine dehydrogenase